MRPSAAFNGTIRVMHLWSQLTARIRAAWHARSRFWILPWNRNIPDAYHERPCEWCADPLAWLRHQLETGEPGSPVVVSPQELLEFMCTKCAIATVQGCQLLETYRKVAVAPDPTF